MKKLFNCTIISFLLLTGVSFAAQFTFDGNITYHNDVVDIGFTLDSDATGVTVWTDSFLSGTNFDPITAVWRDNGSAWALVGQNDDNDGLWAGQTYYDSGLYFSNLDAGDYRFTIARFPNFANGSTLAEGFRFDGDTPQLVSGGTYYRVNLDGVDSATNNTDPVPEPATMLLFGLGLIGLVGASRKRQ